MAVDVKRFPVRDELIFDGMTKILCGSRPSESLNLLWDAGWLKEVFPELERVARFRTKSRSKDLWKHVLQVVENCPKDPMFKWAALFHDVGKPVCYREKRGKVTFSGHEAEGAKIWKDIAKRMEAPMLFAKDVEMIIGESGAFVELKSEHIKGVLTDSAIRRFIKKTDGHLDDIFRFVLADMTSKWDKKLDKMKRESTEFMKRINMLVYRDLENELRPRLPKGTGNLLMDKCGIKGRQLGDVMKQLQVELESDKINVDQILARARDICHKGIDNA